MTSRGRRCFVLDDLPSRVPMKVIHGLAVKLLSDWTTPVGFFVPLSRVQQADFKAFAEDELKVVENRLRLLGVETNHSAEALVSTGAGGWDVVADFAITRGRSTDDGSQYIISCAPWEATVEDLRPLLAVMRERWDRYLLTFRFPTPLRAYLLRNDIVPEALGWVCTAMSRAKMADQYESFPVDRLYPGDGNDQEIAFSLRPSVIHWDRDMDGALVDVRKSPRVFDSRDARLVVDQVGHGSPVHLRFLYKSATEELNAIEKLSSYVGPCIERAAGRSVLFLNPNAVRKGYSVVLSCDLALRS